jgi:hypothetical protein
LCTRLILLKSSNRCRKIVSARGELNFFPSPVDIPDYNHFDKTIDRDESQKECNDGPISYSVVLQHYCQYRCICVMTHFSSIYFSMT